MTQHRVFRCRWFVYVAIFVGAIVASSFLYFVIFPVNPGRLWARAFMLGLAFWIYRDVLFSTLQISVSDTGIETKAILQNRRLDWQEIKKIGVKHNRLEIVGHQHNLRVDSAFFLANKEGRRAFLSMIEERAGIDP